MSIVTPLFREAHPIRAGWTPISKHIHGRLSRIELERTIHAATRRIAPFWPLQHFVAVNPFMGLADHDFQTACELISCNGHGRMLMPASFYADQLAQGVVTDVDLTKAFELLEQTGPDSRTPAELRGQLQLLSEAEKSEQVGSGHRLYTLADHADATTGSQWMSLITDEISKWCAAWCDEGQSAWRMPWRMLPLYNAWKRASQFDRNP